MVDTDWKKYIIKVECEKSSELSKHAESAVSASTIYFCRTCPLFRTPVKELADSHVSEVHKLPSVTGGYFEVDHLYNHCPLKDPIKTEENLPHTLKSEDSPPVDTPFKSATEDTFSVRDQSPLELHSSAPSPSPIDATLSNSPTAPSSPISPVSKDSAGNTRKRITIQLSTFPTASGAIITALPSVEAPHSDVEIEQMTSLHSSSIVTLDSNTNLGDSTFKRSTSLSSSSSPENIPRDEAASVCDQPCEHGIAQTSLTGPAGTVAISPAQAQKPQYPCGYCNRIFASRQACELHARTHKLAKKFQCTLCSVSFTQLALLKRHTVAIHGIVPEATYLDNPDDKDFEITDELDSDSDGSLDTRPQRQPQSRHRRLVPLRPAGDRPRGRPKRLADWTSISSELKPNQKAQMDSTSGRSYYEDPSGLELRLENRFRTILPRPSRGEPTSAPKEITVSRPRRNKRCKRANTTTTDHGTRRPLACEPRVSTKSALQNPDQQFAFTQRRAIYVDQTSLLSNLVTIDSHLGQAYAISYPPAEVAPADETISHTKPAHMLTVAAAYASQLPPGSCSAGPEDQSRSDFAADGDPPNTGTMSMFSVQHGSVIPSIQIYPTSWLQSQTQQQPITTESSLVESTAMSHSEGDTNSIIGGSEYGQADMTQIQHQPVQLYPVVGPDGQTTMYYVAAPLESLDSNGTGLNVTPTNTYYGASQYSAHGYTWLSEVSQPTTDSFHLLIDANKLTTADRHASIVFTQSQESTNPALLEGDGRLEETGDSGKHMEDSDHLVPEATTSAFVNGMVGSHYPMYHAITPTSGPEPSETIEVIDLDASKYSSRFQLAEVIVSGPGANSECVVYTDLVPNVRPHFSEPQCQDTTSPREVANEPDLVQKQVGTAFTADQEFTSPEVLTCTAVPLSNTQISHEESSSVLADSEVLSKTNDIPRISERPSVSITLENVCSNSYPQCSVKPTLDFDVLTGDATGLTYKHSDCTFQDSTKVAGS
ncbi:hypothetical protein EG68_10642 [Paragonimus skrjabini miyazakii]|uniref:C2H2-type domain-containing protein n=1 Tax=Paragonimus skrjabini miyazakii TaxID=59628 RepID=A0A8S9YRM7_9TREM|nr:hypothetical protein EG68_10642 [Paragonimus skrjabini miyazakii]